jgi:hypothetical protein
MSLISISIPLAILIKFLILFSYNPAIVFALTAGEDQVPKPSVVKRTFNI